MFDGIEITAEVAAIGISVFSLALGAFAVGWNVYRDIVLKPRLKVTVSIAETMSEIERDGPFVVVSGINFGPGELTVSMVHSQSTSLWKRLTRGVQNFVIMYDYRNPLNERLPHRLRVGDKIDLFFDFNEKCFLKAQAPRVGLRDSFGRIHWAPRKNVAAMNRMFLDEWIAGLVADADAPQ